MQLACGVFLSAESREAFETMFVEAPREAGQCALFGVEGLLGEVHPKSYET